MRSEIKFGFVAANYQSGLCDPDDPNAGVVGKFKKEFNFLPMVQFFYTHQKNEFDNDM